MVQQRGRVAELEALRQRTELERMLTHRGDEGTSPRGSVVPQVDVLAMSEQLQSVDARLRMTVSDHSLLNADLDDQLRFMEQLDQQHKDLRAHVAELSSAQDRSTELADAVARL